MKALVINQDGQHKRMAFQQQQLTSLGISFQRIPSYTIFGIEDAAFKKHFDTWQRPLTVSEVSCFLSHKTAWEKVALADEPMLILEDDAWLDTNIVNVLTELSEMSEVDYTTLEVTGSNRNKLLAKLPTKIFSEGGLFRLYQGRSGAAGYVLWPEGAKKLLDKTANNKIGLADKFICSCYSLKAYQVEPALIIQLDQCVSHGITPPLEVKTTITTKTEFKPKLLSLIRYKIRRIIGEARIGINILCHSLNTNRKSIVLSENFKNE
jgi:glycosyl transferase family 25